MACRKTATRYFTVGPETGYPLSPFYLLIYFSLKYGEAGQDCFVVNLPQSNAPVQNKKNIIIKTIPIILGSWRGWPSHSRPPVLSCLPFPCSAQVQRSLVSTKCLVEYNNPPRARTRTTRNHEPPPRPLESKRIVSASFERYRRAYSCSFRYRFKCDYDRKFHERCALVKVVL